MIKHHPSIRDQERRWLKRKKLSVPRCPSMHSMWMRFRELDANYALYEPPDNPTPEDILIAAQDSAAIDRALTVHLSPREEFVVRMYHYGINDAEPYKLDEIGEVMGVSRERIRQMLCKSYRKLRYKQHIKDMKDKYRWQFSSYYERKNAEREMREEQRRIAAKRLKWSEPIIVEIEPPPPDPVAVARERAAFDLDPAAVAHYAAVLSDMLARRRGIEP